MALRIEDYGLIGDTQTVALVGRDGSIDWLCLPRFDAGACFAALLGEPAHGRWLIAPAGGEHAHRRRYRGDSLVLEQEFQTPTGIARVIDCMPPRHREPDLVRVVEGVSGRVDMRMELIVRFDYGDIVPWVRTLDGALRAVGGPDAVTLWTPASTRGVGLTTQSTFTVGAGERVQRYPMDETSESVDGLPPGEGAFLACTFWLADNYALQGRHDEARTLFERLLALRNDLGLLSEEFEPDAQRLVGNFPQAFSHVGLINTARNLARAHGPAEDRREKSPASGVSNEERLLTDAPSRR